jgi:hypothetical protein
MILYPEVGSLSDGDLGYTRLMTDQDTTPNLNDTLRRQLQPAPGQEAKYERVMSQLETYCYEVPEEDFQLAKALVGGSILSGKLRSLLGFSEGLLLSRVPKWNLFAVLRLAHVTLAGIICNRFGLRAAKLQFGTEELASATYGLVAEKDTATEVAAYVVTGSFSGNISAPFERNPSLFNFLLNYRESPEAIALRREISEMLAADAGSEFIAALNAGLKRFISIGTTERARNKFSLMTPGITPTSQKNSIVSLIQDESRGARWMKAWRNKSLRQFRAAMATKGLSLSDRCLCGSGEIAKDCCGHPLGTNRS